MNQPFLFNNLNNIQLATAITILFFSTLVMLGLLVHQSFKHRKRLQKQVAERTESLNQLLDKHLNITNSLPVGIALCSNGMLTEMNPKMRTWFGEREDLYNQLKPYLKEVLDHGERFKGQIQLQTGFGRKQMKCTALETVNTGDEKQIVILLEDWTEHLRFEQALKDKTEELERYFNSSTDLLSISTLDGTFLNLNPQWETTLGHPLSEMNGQNLLCFVKEDDRQLAEDLLQKLCDGEIIQNESLRFVHQNGDDVWLEWKATREGNLIHANIRNISKRIQAEAKHLAMQEHVTRAQKMESVGRLAGGIAHDFNNSLQVIIGNAQLALTNRELASATQKQLQDLLAAAEGSAHLTKQLLGFAMKQHVKVDLLNMNETLQDMGPMFKSILGDQIELQWDMDSEVGTVKIDKGQLEQICVNLLENAFDAMPSGGVVRISTQNQDLTEEEVHDWLIDCNPGTYIMLSIEDTGTGIDPDIQVNLFEPFTTTQDPSKGSGLGLATVYGILQQNNGSVRFKSEVSKGSRLDMIFPCDDEQAPPSPTPKPKASEDLKKIVLVDDNPQIIQMGMMLLRQLNYESFSCKSPTEAEEFLESHPDVSLLITDVLMPEKTGQELYLKALKTIPGLKCILMSGYGSDVVDTHQLVPGRCEFLSKPFSLETIKETISRLLSA